MIIVQPLIIHVMMEKKYQLVAWTRNITDPERARLYVVPSVQYELTGPYVQEVAECRREQERHKGHISLCLARRFVRAYEESARLEFLTGHLDDAVRFLFMAADYAHRRKELRNEFVGLCEEAISLGKKYGFEYIFTEEKPKMTLGRYRHIKKDPAR